MSGITSEALTTIILTHFFKMHLVKIIFFKLLQDHFQGATVISYYGIRPSVDDWIGLVCGIYRATYFSPV